MERKIKSLCDEYMRELREEYDESIRELRERCDTLEDTVIRMREQACIDNRHKLFNYMEYKNKRDILEKEKKQLDDRDD